MTTIERLEELLNERDEQIQELTDRIEAFEEMRNDDRWRWARHEQINNDELPTPRLEIRCDVLGDYHQSWTYAMVYRHLLGHSVRVPLGHTEMNGSFIRSNYDLMWYMPFRDGAHIKNDMRQLNLPAYVIMDGKTQQIEVNN